MIHYGVRHKLATSFKSLGQNYTLFYLTCDQHAHLSQTTTE